MVRHFLKDGKQVDSVKNHLIRKKDYPLVYQIAKVIAERGENNELIQTPKRRA